MTSLAEERDAQRQWTPRADCATPALFDELVANEFRPPETLRAWQARTLRAVVRYAAETVPFYAQQLARTGVRAEHIATPADLERLPVLTKDDVLDSFAALQAARLPPGVQLAGTSLTSGTTGRPVAVVHTATDNAMYTYLRQRHCRWHRLDPRRTRIDVRASTELVRSGQAAPVVRFPAWRHVGRFFETGPELAIHVATPIPAQIELLRELRPAYAMSYPGVFEEWLFEADGHPPVDSLEVLLSVGTQLSSSLRARLERDYRLPVHESYGLNEIGLVAVRCDAGRFHAHAEHCHVEIVDAEGHACRGGETGRLVVTALRNAAMPLVRYDTGDLAEATDGPCACGRTLPSFGAILGRFRRYVGLPDGTRQRLWAVLGIFDALPAAELRFIRRYQIHQDREDQFRLELVTAAPVPDAFRTELARLWAPVARGTRLTIVEVDALAPSPGGKHQDFTSELYGDPFGRASRES